MHRDLGAMSGQKFDLAIIGGGINGAATAREAALLGLKVVLVDVGEFSAGTSSRSPKLIHGGLRYLEQFSFKLVHESRTEPISLTCNVIFQPCRVAYSRMARVCIGVVC